MEEIKINHSFWKTLLSAIGCLEVFAMMIHMTEDLSTYTILGLLFISICISGFGLGSLYFLSVLIKERLGGKPFMRVSEDGLLIVNRLLRKKVIKLSDVRHFGIKNISDPFILYICYTPDVERQKIKNLRRTIWLDFIDTDADELLVLLNKCKKLSKPKHSSQTPNEIQRNKLRKLFMDYNQSGQTQKKSPKEIQDTPNYYPMFRVLFVSVIMAAIYALICWGWLKWRWASSELRPILLVAPLILNFYICRKFLLAIKDFFYGYIVAVFVFGILPLILLENTGKMVERMTMDITEVPAITSETEPILASAEYVRVANLSTADLDTIRGDYYFKVKHVGRGSINFLLYGAYPLRAIPNVFLVSKKREIQGYAFTKKEALEKMRLRFIEKETGFMLKMDLNDSYLKRLVSRDDIKEYQEAIKEILKKENKPFDQNNIILYKITSGKMGKKGVIHYGLISLATLLGEFILLLIVYKRFFNYKEYERAVKKSQRKKLLKIHTTPDKALLFSIPVLMVIIYMLMLINGYSMNTQNVEMCMQWGAVERVSVLERHEWWRLLTFGFLHGDIKHLLGNVSLFVGSAMFLLHGHNGYRITLVFLLSTFVSGLFFLLFGSGYCCVGASGGVFGIMGFWLAYELYIKYVNKDRVTFVTVRYPLIMIVINLLFSFGYGISMSCHIGGLVAGIIMAIIIGAKNKSRANEIE